MTIIDKLTKLPVNTRQIALMANIPADRVYKWQQGKSSPSAADIEKLENVFPIISNYEVLKGQEYAYKERPMLDNAVELWQEACAGANNEDYVFGEDLSPSLIPAGDYVIKMRWQRMQKVLGIKKGMYQLKHTHSTEVRKKIGLKMTAELNAESEKMIEKHYDLEAEQREMDAIKSVNVPFV